MKGQKKPKDLEAETELPAPLEELPQGVVIERRPTSLENWIPKTSLGKKIKNG
ncbi:hypothetical protein HYX18_01985, partial [Candidatus Woesearchaeota archaeon]|nr:hypothetical protein [Candidatus Woesearchaeota archaeon]